MYRNQYYRTKGKKEDPHDTREPTSGEASRIFGRKEQIFPIGILHPILLLHKTGRNGQTQNLKHITIQTDHLRGRYDFKEQEKRNNHSPGKSHQANAGTGNFQGSYTLLYILQRIQTRRRKVFGENVP